MNNFSGYSPNQMLHNLLEQQAKDNTVIIVFANNAYRKVLDNWLIGIKRLGIENILVFALDVTLGKYLDDSGVANFVINIESELGALWIKRVEIIMDILEAGYHVVHSDADAVWLKNPVQQYFTHSPYDMIFSQGTYWPPDVHEKWGFVLCCGLFYIKSCEQTLWVLRAIHESTLKTRDDQIACNRIIRDLGVKWDIAEEYWLEYNGKPFRCSPKPITGISAGLRIMLLPHQAFQRIAELAENIYIKHHISNKNSESKISQLKACDCYLL